MDTTLGPQFDDPIGYAYVDLVVVPSDVTAVVRGGSRDAVDNEALVLIVDATDPDDPLNLLEGKPSAVVFGFLHECLKGVRP